jgi:hypothetical protein
VNSSPSITELSKALNAAQKEMKNPTFDSTNPHFKSKFASLVAVREAVIPILNKHGLSIAQFPKATEGTAGCVNRLMHVSGEWLEEECLLPLDKNNAQGAGSAVTYARRYSLQAIAGVVADEDDDAHAASAPAKKPEPQRDLEAEGLLSQAAHKGTAAFRNAWLAMPEKQRGAVSQSTLADLKAICDEADKVADKA